MDTLERAESLIKAADTLIDKDHPVAAAGCVATAQVLALIAIAQELRTANEIAMVMGGLAIGNNRQLKLQ